MARTRRSSSIAPIAQKLEEQREYAESLTGPVRKAVSETFDIPHHAAGTTTSYALIRKPYRVEHIRESSFSLVPAGFVKRFIFGRFPVDRTNRRF